MPSSDNGLNLRTFVDLPEVERAQLDALCRERGLSRAEALRLWLEQQQRPRISVISWIEVLVGCREGESERVQAWLETFPRLPLNDAIALESVRLRQRPGHRPLR
jgi:predicted nucleic acid-binding protein